MRPRRMSLEDLPDTKEDPIGVNFVVEPTDQTARVPTGVHYQAGERVRG